jgi:hypothetical protein
VGLLTAALAVAAHGAASGTPPSGAAAAQLAVVAGTVAALAATMARAADPWVLLGLLASGQLVGHVMLDAVGHAHAPATAPPGAVMLIAHLIAVAAGAALIAAGDRLWGALSRAVRAALADVMPPPADTAAVAVRQPDQPLRFMALLDASMSHRGPPVSLAR